MYQTGPQARLGHPMAYHYHLQQQQQHLARLYGAPHLPPYSLPSPRYPGGYGVYGSPMSHSLSPLVNPATLSGLIKDAILQLCRSNAIYRGNVEVEGIICISGSQEGQQLVIKLHEKLHQNGAPNGTHKEANGEQGTPAKRPRFESPLCNGTENGSTGSQNDHSPQLSPNDDMKAEDEEVEDDGSMSDGELGEISKSDKDILDLSNKTAAELSQDGNWPFCSESRLRSLLTKGLVGRSHMLPFFGRRMPFNMPPMMQPPSPECKTCGLVIYEPDLLREHNETQHGVFTCGICYRTFTSRSNLERHSRLHTGHRPYVCNKCGKAFSRKDHLTNHSAKHAFKCSKCLKRFVEKENLRQHYDRDHNIQMTDICMHCNKGFHDAHQYREHMKSHPEVYRKMGCRTPYDTDSKQSSGRESSLTPPPGKSPSPKLSPTSVSTPPSPDDLCDSSPNSLSSSAKNFKHRLPHYYKYQCNECHMMYSNAEDLDHHKKHIHDLRQDGFTCISCYENFTSSEDYSEHFRIHKDEMNVFECPTCRQILQTYNSLRAHEELHVTDIKPKDEEEIDVVDTDESATYLCPYCAKVYPTESLLMEHVSIHEGLQRQYCKEDMLKKERVSPRKSPSPSKVRVEEASSSELHEDKSGVTIHTNVPSVIEVDGRDMDKIKREVEHSPEVSTNEDSMDSVGHWVSIKSHKYSYNVPVPEISFMCSICSCLMPNFKEYESHCFAAHYRYPCMYCHKTFAQRPNRDRHVCIHTGDKPFACPECNLKFSRGDKLKIHRIKVHKLEYPGPYVRLTNSASASTTSVTSSQAYNSA